MVSRSRTAPAKGMDGSATGEKLSTSERIREVGSLLLLGLTLFVSLACLSAGRGDNMCGPTGEAVAVWLLQTFGFATWLIVLCFGSWGVALFARVAPPAIGLKVSGLALCLISTSALLANLFSGVSSRWPPGGTLGRMLSQALEVSGGMGTVGTRLVLVVLALVTFVLATDVAFYASFLAGAKWVGERRRKLATAAAEVEAEPARRSPRSRAAVVEEDEADAVEEYVDDAPEADDLAADEYEDSDEQEVAVEDPEPWDVEPEEVEELDEPDEELAADEPWDAEEGELADEDEFADDEVAQDEAGVADAQPAAVGATSDALEDEAAELSAEDEEDDAYEDEEPDDAEYEAEDGEGDEYLEYEDDEDADDEAVEEGDEEEGVEYEDEALDHAAREKPRVREMVDPAAQAPLPFSPRPAKASAYVFPSEGVLDDQEAIDQKELDELLAEKTSTLEKTLESFRIQARVVEIQKGPVISMFEMELAPGIKLGRVRSLEDDLAIALRARTVRIVAPIPGKNTIGIEVPNPIRETVRLKPLLHCREFSDGKQLLPVFLGRDSAGRPLVLDLARMPHLLVAGATGAGKSVCLNTIICSFLFTRTPEQVKLILIDPKMVEMSMFSDAPHLACPVVTDMKRAPGILEWAVNKMEERYKLLARAGVRNLAGFNKLSEERLRARFGDAIDDEDFPRKLPSIVIVVDELADLMMTAAKDVETSISRLAAKSRAVGIHVVLATQRPSTNVITGLIKANLPTRIAFMVSSKIDSRVILDSNGADQLLGAGDMLLLSPEHTGLVRGQCTFMSDDEVSLVMESVKTESGPRYENELVQRRSESDTDPTEVDELYDAATRFIIGTQRGSASLLQRKFAIGYTRASRLIDLMAGEGVLGEFKGSQARDVEMTLEDWVAINPEARGADDDEAAEGAAALAG